MKRILPYLLTLSVLILAQSCTKGVLVPDRQFQNADITGSWVLSETTQYSGSGWNYFSTGLEKGVFTFYRDGGAMYDDGFSQLTGSWDIRTLSNGYYDRYGNYQNDVHQSLRIHVEDRYANNSVDLYFDDVVVTYSNIIATSYNGHTVSRYIFSRY